MNSWVLQIRQHARRRGARLAARRRQALRDAVITERALLRHVLFRMDEPAAVRTRLDAIAAAETVLLIHQHHAVRSRERGAHRANLRARGIRAVVAQLGHEELFHAGRKRPGPGGEAVPAAVGRIDDRLFHVLVVHLVALHPRPEEAFRNVVLRRAGPHAVAAADALIHVDQHGPPVIGNLVIRRRFRSAGQNAFPRHGGRARERNEEAAVHVHFLSPMCGLCGVWHVLHGRPCECSALTTAGNHFGFAVLAS